MATLPARRRPLGQGKGFASQEEAVNAAVNDLGWIVTVTSGESPTAEDGKWFLCKVKARWHWELTWEPPVWADYERHDCAAAFATMQVPIGREFTMRFEEGAENVPILLMPVSEDASVTPP